MLDQRFRKLLFPVGLVGHEALRSPWCAGLYTNSIFAGYVLQFWMSQTSRRPFWHGIVLILKCKKKPLL
jgi:hypothetical protein